MDISEPVNAVQLKLPAFWTEQPRVWFAQAEAQFTLRNITQDDTRYYHTVAALDQQTASRVISLLECPPASAKYVALKSALLDTYTLTEAERANRLLHLPGLGDSKPSELMDHMLSLLGTHKPCFLFRQLFMEQLPSDIGTHLASSHILDYRDLAREADKLLLARSNSQCHAIHASDADPAISAFDMQLSQHAPPHPQHVARISRRPGHAKYPAAAASHPPAWAPPAVPRSRAPTSARHTAPSSQPTPPSSGHTNTHSSAAPQPHPAVGVCYFHRRYGANARSCKPPCTFTLPGNGQTGRW